MSRGNLKSLVAGMAGMAGMAACQDSISTDKVSALGDLRGNEGCKVSGVLSVVNSQAQRSQSGRWYWVYAEKTMQLVKMQEQTQLLQRCQLCGPGERTH